MSAISEVQIESFFSITSTILNRLQEHTQSQTNLDELSRLLTRWWCEVVKMELPWHEKEKAAKALVYFRAYYDEFPGLTATEVRIRSKKILNIARRAPTLQKTIVSPKPTEPQLTTTELFSRSMPRNNGETMTPEFVLRK